MGEIVFLQIRIEAVIEWPTDAPSLADGLGVDPSLADLFGAEVRVIEYDTEVIGVTQRPEIGGLTGSA